jgi:hypothetical protein
MSGESILSATGQPMLRAASTAASAEAARASRVIGIAQAAMTCLLSASANAAPRAT